MNYYNSDKDTCYLVSCVHGTIIRDMSVVYECSTICYADRIITTYTVDPLYFNNGSLKNNHGFAIIITFSEIVVRYPHQHSTTKNSQEHTPFPFI